MGFVIALWLSLADQVTPAFTYQGVLTEASGPANGRFDLRFALFDAAEQGHAVAPMIETNALPVTDGLFTVVLDFGPVFDGRKLWLEIAERTNGVGSFAILTPRQALTAVPYASYTLRAGTAATATSAAGVAPGSVTFEALASAAVTADKVASGQVVKSLNGLTDSVTLAAGPNVSLAANGNTVTISAAGGGATGGWSTTGNAGTAPGLNFLGTIDNQPFEFRVNNQRLLRLEPGANGLGNLVGGAAVNTVEPGIFGAVIGGGGEPAWPNSIAADYGTIAGGLGNRVNGQNAVIGGGAINAIEGGASDSVIAGGRLNVIERSSAYGFIGGGQYNTNGYLSVGAVVPGGKDNYAGGMMSFAAGTRAKAITDGDFVWADHTDEDFSATGANQFLVRAHGGVGINTNKPQAALHVAGTVQADKFVGSGAGLTPGSVAAAALAPGAVSQLGTPDGANLDAVQVANDSSVGIGTANPLAGLEIASSLSHPAPFVMFEVANGALDYTNLAGANCVAAQDKVVAIGASQPGSVTLLDVSSHQPVIESVLLNGMVIRVLDPNQPEQGLLQLRGVRGVALNSGRLAVAALNDNAVWLFSVTDPTQPTPLARLKDGVAGFNQLAGPSAVAFSGNVLIVAAARDNAVNVVDIADPAHPQLLAVMAQGVNGHNGLLAPGSLALSGSLLAIGSSFSSTVTLVDISTPANPVKLAEIVQGSGGFDKLRGVTGVALEGRLLAIAAYTDNAVTLADVNQPARPLLKGVIQDGVGGFNYLAGPKSVAFNNRRLAVGASSDNAVTLLDVTDAANPQLASQARHGVAGSHFLVGTTGLTFVGAELAAAASGDSSFTLLDWPNQPMGLVSQGWVGVGTEHPTAALDVVGNVVVENADRVNLNANRIELGENNRAEGTDTVAMGRESVSTGYASVAAGYGVRATGHESVALGDHTLAAADGAVALGSRAEALHPGSFVWADSTAGAFLSTGNNQFLIRASGGVGINQTNPASALDVNGTVTAAAFQGDGAGLTNLSSANLTGLLTSFVGPPLSPAAHLNNGGYARGVAVAGHYCYLANDNDGLRICDISNPASPVDVGHANDGPSAYDVAVAGKYCYLANLGDGLRIYDVSDPSHPLSVGHASTQKAGAYAVAVAGHYCYVANGGDGLRLYDVSDPANPVNVGHIMDGDLVKGASAEGVAVAGNYCFLANYLDGLRIYDVSSPAHPISVGHIAYDVGIDARAEGVAVAGNFCYLANVSDGLRVYDVSNPTNPVSVSHVDSGDAIDVTVAGSYCYLANGEGGLRIYDISQPAKPVDVGGAHDGWFANSVAVASGYCYLGNHDDGLRVYALVGGGVQVPIIQAGLVEGNVQAPSVKADLVQGRMIQGASLQVSNPDPAEARLTSTASGAGDWSLGTGWTGAGRPSFYLYDNVTAKARLTVNEGGSVGIGTVSPTDALLDVEGNVRVNDNDLFLRGESDRYHGLGWYGQAKPFGDAQPDGPVLYGNAGGALATTSSGKQTALSWDANGVTVAKDLNVTGTLKVGGHAVQQPLPQVYYSQHWDFQSWGAGRTSDIARCTVPRTGPGIYLILGQTTVWNTDEVWVYLYDTDQQLPLADGRFIDDDPLLANTEFGCVVSMHWLVPVTGAGPDKQFAMSLLPDDDAMTASTSLVVIFFPASVGAQALASAASAAATLPATDQSASPVNALSALLPPAAANHTPPLEVLHRRDRIEGIDQALKEKDTEIAALKTRLDKLERLVSERTGANQ